MLPPDYTPPLTSTLSPPLLADPPRHAAGPGKPRLGGPRPGAGAPKGNLNALKHGRHSRFRDLLGHDPSAVALAGRLVARERRELERHAATLLRLSLLVRHRRAYVAAVEQGLPLPQPPLVDLVDLDLAPLFAYLERVAQRARDERARRAGALTPAGPAVAAARTLAGSLDTLVRLAAAQLDQAAAALPTPTALAALLDATPLRNNQPLNQPTPAAPNLRSPFTPADPNLPPAAPQTPNNQTPLRSPFP